MLAGSEGPLLVNLQPTGSGYYYGDASVMGMGIKAMPPGIMQADGQWAADALPLHHYDHRQQAALYYQHSTALRVAQHVAAPPNVLLPGGHGTLPQDHMGWNNTQPGPDVGHAVGWGGQTIADSRPKVGWRGEMSLVNPFPLAWNQQKTCSASASSRPCHVALVF